MSLCKDACSMSHCLDAQFHSLLLQGGRVTDHDFIMFLLRTHRNKQQPQTIQMHFCLSHFTSCLLPALPVSISRVLSHSLYRDPINKVAHSESMSLHRHVSVQTLGWSQGGRPCCSHLLMHSDTAPIRIFTFCLKKTVYVEYLGFKCGFWKILKKMKFHYILCSSVEQTN